MERVEDDKLAQVLREFGDKASANTVFGEPVRVGDLTIIPVAQVAWNAGRGRWFGSRLGRRFGPHIGTGGPRPAAPSEQNEPLTGEEGGAPAGPHPEWSGQPLRPFGAGGVGGHLRVRPLAVLEIGPNGTRVRPIRDTTKLLLGMFALIGWNVYWITRTLRAIFGRRRRRYETVDAG